MTDILTEFLYLDTEELHLVSAGANGFAPLLAKAALEVDAVLGEADVQAVLYEMGAEKTLCDDADCQPCTAVMEKAKLKAKQRNALPDSDFALPGRRYPIHDESHARNALSRVAQNGTPEEKSKVRAAVHRRYPNIGQEDAEKAMTSQESGEHQAGNGSPEASLGQTRENNHTPNGGRGPVHTDTSHVQGNPPSKPQPTPDQHQGGGTTAPDKSIPTGEAESQTDENLHKAGSGDGRGTTDPRSAADDAESKTESESQTEEETRKADADTDPGSPGWEAKDIALANKAVDALTEALYIVKEFASREKAEARKGEINVAISRATEILSGLVVGNNNNQVATKEIEDMTKEELMELLDARDAKKEADRKAAEETAAKTQAKPDEAEVQTAEKGAPAPESEGTPDAESLTKSVTDAVTKALSSFEARITNIENQPARPRPAVNDSGVRAGVAAPETRGQDQPAGGENVFKALEDRVANARTTQERERYSTELLKAKAIASERVREAQGPSRGPVALLATSAPTKEAREAMAADFRG